MERAKVIFAFTSEQEDELSIQVYCLTHSHPHTSHPHTVTLHTSHPHTSYCHTLHPHTSYCHTLHPHTSHLTPPHPHTPHTITPSRLTPHILTPLHPHASHCHTLTPHIATPPTGGPGLTSLLHILLIYLIPLHTVPLTSHTSPHTSCSRLVKFWRWWTRRSMDGGRYECVCVCVHA